MRTMWRKYILQQSTPEVLYSVSLAWFLPWSLPDSDPTCSAGCRLGLCYPRLPAVKWYCWQIHQFYLKNQIQKFKKKMKNQIKFHQFKIYQIVPYKKSNQSTRWKWKKTLEMSWFLSQTLFSLHCIVSYISTGHSQIADPFLNVQIR